MMWDKKMADEMLIQRREGSVAFIVFPSTPIDTKQLQATYYNFADLCAEISSNDDIRVCAIKGITTQTFASLASSRDGLSHWAACSENGPSLAGSAAALDIPLIIGMEGDIVGPGLELALACDVRLATPASRFWFPHMEMRWIPFEGATQLLPRLIGRGRALEMLLTGSLIDATSAHETGLIHRIVSGKDLHSSMSEMACKMAEKSPGALRYTKEAVNKGLDLTLDQGLRLEADLYFLLHSTEDRIEGINAFKEKRKPSFKGN